MTHISDEGQVTAFEIERTKSSSTTCGGKNDGANIGQVLISGIGFLADAYDLFVIDFVLAILKHTSASTPSVSEEGIVASATLAGAVIGQLGFGVAADFIGRRIMFITTAALVIFGSISSALVGWYYTKSSLSLSIFYQLAICRFFLGIGIGGEYPLSATVASENESISNLEEAAINALNGTHIKPVHKGCWYLRERPNSIAAVFSMQGVGMLLSPLIVMSCIAAGLSLESTWRLCLGIGAIPSAIAFYFRWKMQETAAFSKSKRDYSLAESSSTRDTPLTSTLIQKEKIIEKKVEDNCEEKKPKINLKEFGKHLKRSWNIMKQFRWVLVGTSMTWFLIDVTLYATASYKSDVVYQWADHSTTTTTINNNNNILLLDHDREIMERAQLSTYVALIAIPGYILSVFFIHKTGQKRLQFWGFISLASVYVILGIAELTNINKSSIGIILYGLTFLFSNFGPNTTTFILPTQLYPTLVRATCHGFSAAMGKLGGVLGSSLFQILKAKIGFGWLMILLGFVSFTGAGFTLFIPNDKKARLKLLQEEMSLASKARQTKNNTPPLSPPTTTTTNETLAAIV